MDKWALKDSERNPKTPMRARGNLSYLEFINLVKETWNMAHPNIPIVASMADDPAKYPCIVYSLQIRKTHPNEPKMKYREQRNDNDDVFIVGGQRFQNIVYFEATGESKDVDTIEHLIEVFEDFMIEHIPVFKELGVSELVYARRLSDSEVARPGANVARRTVSYLVTTEKVISTRYDRLQEIVIKARTSMQNAKELYAGGTIYDSSPRYHLIGPDAYLTYSIKNIATESNFEDLIFTIPRTNFRINDTLWLMPQHEEAATPSATPDFFPEPVGFFSVTNMVGNPYAVDVGYTLTARGGVNPPVDLVSPYGVVQFIPDSVGTHLIDTFWRNNT